MGRRSMMFLRVSWRQRFQRPSNLTASLAWRGHLARGGLAHLPSDRCASLPQQLPGMGEWARQTGGCGFRIPSRWRARATGSCSEKLRLKYREVVVMQKGG